MSNLRTLPCDGHEGAQGYATPHAELRRHAMIAPYLYHGCSEVALKIAMGDSLDGTMMCVAGSSRRLAAVA
jgi:hypothetical protein